MNKEFERIAKLLNVHLPIPTDEEIEDTISRIEERLAEKKINKFINAPVKEGYTLALNLLKSKQEDYTGIVDLDSMQGRFIATIAVDYLKGECSQEILCGVPLK